MPRIQKTEANLFPLPKGATVVKATNRVYVNVGNYRAVSQKTGKGYTSHSKVCIGLIRLDRSGDPTTELYANSKYFQIFKADSLPLPPDRSDTQYIGMKLVVEKICEEYKLKSILNDVFQEEETNLILDLCSFIVIEEKAVFQHYERWSRKHFLFSDSIRSDSYISKFLGESLTVSKIKLFLLKWARIHIGDGNCYLCYDSTNTNSQAEGITIVQKGYAKDDKTLPQVNTDFVIRQEDGLPITFKEFPGSVVDIAEAPEIIDFLKPIAEKLGITLVCDRGYISLDNVLRMLDAGIDFLLMLRSNMNDSKYLLDIYSTKIKKKNKYKLDKMYEYSPLEYGMTVEMPLFGEGKNMFFHIIWNQNLETKHINEYHKNIENREKNLQLYKDKKRNLTQKEIKDLSRWHDITYNESGVIEIKAKNSSIKKKVTAYNITSFEINHDKVDADIEKCGYYILVTSKQITAREAKLAYSKRDSVEKVFQALKSSLGMSSIGVHSDNNLHGKSLLWFIASIIHSIIFSKTDTLKKNNRRIYTVPEAVGALDEIVADKNVLTNKYERRYTITKEQKNILSCFGLNYNDIDNAINEL